MSCKLGGQPWAVDIPLKKTMVVGYDTYHDTVDKKKSVGALVATLNDSFRLGFTWLFDLCIHHLQFLQVNQQL